MQLPTYPSLLSGVALYCSTASDLRGLPGPPGWGGEALCHPRGPFVLADKGQESQRPPREEGHAQLKLQTTLQLLFHILEEPLMAHGLIPMSKVIRSLLLISEEMAKKQILEEATTRPAKHHFSGSGTEGDLHPEMAAPALPAAQEADSQRRETQETNRGGLTAWPLCWPGACAPQSPTGLSHHHTNQLFAAEGHRSCLITALYAETHHTVSQAH